MSSRQLRSESRASQESQESPDNSDSQDVHLAVRQQKLDHQRELLEKRQRRKRLDPMMAQPIPVPGLPLAKKKSEEKQFHQRSSCPPGTDFNWPGAADAVGTMRPNDQDSVPGPPPPPPPLNSSAGTSTAIDAVCADLELPDSSQDSFVTIKDNDEFYEELRLRKLTSEKFSNIHDVAGTDKKDLDRKRPVSSWGSLRPIEKIEALDIMPHSPVLASKKFYHKNAIAAQVIMDSDEEDKEGQDSAEVILTKPLPLPTEEELEGTASLKSAAGSTESSETSIPEVNAPLSSLSNMKDFVYHQAPQNVTVRCRILRGIDGFFPSYFMYVKTGENKAENEEMFVLAARKYKGFMRSGYIIYTDITDFYRGGWNFVGRLRANFMKTKYTLYNNDMDPDLYRDLRERCSTQQKLGTITYKNKALGFRRSKNLTVIIPCSTGTEEQVPVESQSAFRNFFSKWIKRTKDNVFQLQNTDPVASGLTPRMKETSHKTLELIQGSEPSCVVMHLEHVIKHKFVLDYSYPLSPLQAFAIALSRFDRG